MKRKSITLNAIRKVCREPIAMPADVTQICVTNRNLLRTLFTLALLSGAAACGGGGGGGSDTPDPPPTPPPVAQSDLKSRDMTLMIPSGAADELQIGHPTMVSVEIDSELAESNVGLQIFLLNKADYGDGTPCVDANSNPIVCPDGSDGDDSKRLLVGSTYFPNVVAGISSHTLEIQVPYAAPETDCLELADGTCATTYCNELSMEDKGKACSSNLDCQNGDGICGDFEPVIIFEPLQAGEYYLFAELDPADLISESSEDNNSPLGDDFPAGAVLVDVSGTYAGMVNLVLESIVIDIDNPSLFNGVMELVDPSRVVQTPPDFCGDQNSGHPFDPGAIADLEDSTIGITAIISASGSYGGLTLANEPTSIPTVRVTAEINHPNLPSPYPLKFWDSTAQLYQDFLEVRDVKPGVPTSVHLDLRLDFEGVEEALAQAEICLGDISLTNCSPLIDLVSDLQEYYGVCAIGDTFTVPFLGTFDLPSSFPDLIACLEQAELDVKLTALTSTGAELAEFEPAGLEFGNNFSLDMQLRPEPEPATTADNLLDLTVEEGFYSDLLSVGIDGTLAAGINYADGAFTNLDVALVGSLFDPDQQLVDLIRLTSAGNAKPNNPLDNKLKIDLFVGPIVLLTADSSAATGVLATLGLGQCELEGFTNVGALRKWQVGGEICPTTAGNNCLSMDGTERKECLRDCWALGVGDSITRDFLVGPVPMTASFNYGGLAGFQINAGIPCDQTLITQFTASSGPWAALEGSASAAVGNSRLFAAGAGGDLTIVEETMYARAVADMDLLPSNQLSYTLRFDVTDDREGPSGSLYLYAGYPCIKICRKWGVPYVCGWKQCKQKWPFMDFDSTQFDKSDVLYCAEDTGTVGL